LSSFYRFVQNSNAGLSVWYKSFGNDLLIACQGVSRPKPKGNWTSTTGDAGGMRENVL
jgi:hypothetical protein